MGTWSAAWGGTSQARGCLCATAAASSCLHSPKAITWGLVGATLLFVRDDGGGDATYDAFISYNHAGDRPLAIAVQTGLQQFAKPWYRRSALRVFRDESSLSATPGLWPTIERALTASNYFVLVASPESSQSHWAGQEVRYWLHLGRRDRLLLVLSAGQLTWAQQDFDWTRTDALPPVLRGVFDQEPLHVDLRWARAQNAVSRRDARLTEPLASLAAPMHGRPRDALIGDDLRQHRRTLRIARSAVVTLVVLLLAAVMASVVAVGQRDRAEREARSAMARLLGNESTSVGPDGVDVGLLLAAQAYAAEPDAPSSWVHSPGPSPAALRLLGTSPTPPRPPSCWLPRTMTCSRLATSAVL